MHEHFRNALEIAKKEQICSDLLRNFDKLMPTIIKHFSLSFVYVTKGKPFECDMAAILFTFHIRKISPRYVVIRFFWNL